MEKQFYNLNRAANAVELDLTQFVGITGAATILSSVFFKNKSVILNFFQLGDLPEYQEITIVLILALLSSVIVYQTSGWCLDWIYDYFYPEKKNKNSDLNKYIRSARKKWRSINIIYKDASIYEPTLEKVEKDDKWVYKKIRKKLAYSKMFRMIVIPLIILGGIKIVNNDVWLGLLVLAAAIICLCISFNYRAEHSKKLYRWFIST